MMLTFVDGSTWIIFYTLRQKIYGLTLCLAGHGTGDFSAKYNNASHKTETNTL